MRGRILWLLAAALAIASVWSGPAAAKQRPVSVELVPRAELTSDGVATADLRVRGKDGSVAVSLRATGAASILGVTRFTLMLEKGAEAVVPVRYELTGSGEALVRASVRGGAGGAATAVVYVLAAGGEALHGRAGPLALRVAALERRRAAGTLAGKAFEAALAAATGSGATSTFAAAGTPGTVSGVVRWTDSAGGTHPVAAAPVELRPAGGGDPAAVTTTDVDGSYSLPTPVAGDFFVRVLARGPGFLVRSDSGDVHRVDSDVHAMEPALALELDLTAGNVEDNATAFSVADALLTGVRYTEARHGSAPPHVDVVFPSFGTFYDAGAAEIHLLQLDRFDWDVSLHEYGHHVSNFLGLDASPGGSHFFGNLSEAFGKDHGIHLAWGEGWPTFFGVSLQHALGIAVLEIPFVGDSSYSDTEDLDLHVDLEADVGLRPLSGLGEDDELSVMRALWDVYDAEDDDGDFGLALGDAALWGLLDGADAVTLSDAFRALAAGRTASEAERLGCVFTEQRVAPARVGPEDAALLSSSPPTFSWRANGGGPSFRNDQFVLELYDATLSRLLLASPPLAETTYTPSRAEWRSVQDAAGGTIRWLVRGAQSAEPPTGPYVGCSRGFAPAESPPPPVAEPPFEIVAELGMPAPGGGTLLDHFETATLSHRGEVGFVTDLENGQGFFVSRGGELREVVRTGMVVDGVTLGPGSIDHVSLSDTGETAFAWALDDSPPPPFGRGAGLFRADAHGRVTTLMLPGVTPAPGGGIFQGARVAAISNGGDVAFGGLVGAGSAFGVYLARRNGSIVALMRPGEPAPGGGTFGSAILPSINEGGDVVFAATIAGVPGRGLFRARADGELEAIVRPGASVPGRGGTFRFVGRSVVNARGDVLFAASVTRAGTPPFVGELYLATAAGIRPVVQFEDELPDGFEFFSLFGGLGLLGLNDAGDVAFVADSFKEDVENLAVYASSKGSLRLIIRDGETVPGLGPVVISFDSPALIDQQGNVVFGLFTFDEGRQLLVRG